MPKATQNVNKLKQMDGSDKHTGMVVVNDIYEGLAKISTNSLRNPTPSGKASFLPGINKKVII